jgi:hypothetical protein
MTGASDEPFRATIFLALSCAVSSHPEAARLLEEGAALTERAAPAHAEAIPFRRAHVALRTASPSERDRCIEEARRLIESVPDGAGEAVGVAKMALQHELAALGAAARGEDARFAADGSWFRVGTNAADLSRVSTLRSVLRVLVEHYPGPGLAAERLFELAWNGERARPSAARARVYTAVRRLRALGLRDLLIRRAAGFALDPNRRLAVDTRDTRAMHPRS